LNVRQVEWQGRPAVAIAYTSDRQQVLNILMFIVLGSTFGLSLALIRRYGLLALSPLPVAVIITLDALRQKMFILIDAKRRFLTGVRRGLLLTRELFTVQVVGVNEIAVEDSTARLTRVIGPEAGKEGGTRKFHVIAKGRSGAHLICSTSSEKNATLVAFAVSRATGKRLGGRVNLSHWQNYIEILEEEEKQVLDQLISGRHHPLS
jgi:hypothetical protein